MVTAGRLIFIKLSSTRRIHLRQLHNACGWRVSLGTWALVSYSLHLIKLQTDKERRAVVSIILILHFIWSTVKFSLLKCLTLLILFKHSGAEEFSGSFILFYCCWKFGVKKDGVDRTYSMHMEDEAYYNVLSSKPENKNQPSPHIWAQKYC